MDKELSSHTGFYTLLVESVLSEKNVSGIPKKSQATQPTKREP
jgi:hypothetical protein